MNNPKKPRAVVSWNTGQRVHRPKKGKGSYKRGADGEAEVVSSPKDDELTRDEVVQYLVKQIDELHDEASEPIETIIETFLGELMDEVEKEAIFWEQ